MIMKKRIVFLSVLLVGLTAAIFSCSKDDAEHQKQQNPQMSERHLEINRLINDFKEDMAYVRKNPTAKNDETVPAFCFVVSRSYY
jgi:cell division protein FtsB